jgi:hypothetical protein
VADINVFPRRAGRTVYGPGAQEETGMGGEGNVVFGVVLVGVHLSSCRAHCVVLSLCLWHGKTGCDDNQACPGDEGGRGSPCLHLCCFVSFIYIHCLRSLTLALLILTLPRSPRSQPRNSLSQTPRVPRRFPIDIASLHDTVHLHTVTVTVPVTVLDKVGLQRDLTLPTSSSS